MDPDSEVIFVYPNLFRVYKSGRIERFPGTELTVPACVDPATGVASKDVIIDSVNDISARVYLPKSAKKKLPILVYFHGGAFCVSSAAAPEYHLLLNTLVSHANMVAVSVSYRLATEHLLPVAYEDSWAALKWVFGSDCDKWVVEYGDFERVFVAGDSAGGNITHQMVLRAAGNYSGGKKMKIEGMALIHPYFWGRDAIGGSEPTEPHKRKFMEELWKVVNLPGADLDDPTINPLSKGAPSLAGLKCKRAIVCVAGEDWLVERGRVFYETLKESEWKGEVELFESQGEHHCFFLSDPDCDDALRLKEKLVGFFKGEGNDRVNCIWDFCVGSKRK